VTVDDVTTDEWMTIDDPAYDVAAPDNFNTDEPTVERYHEDLEDDDDTNDDAVKLTGLSGREINVEFVTVIGSDTEETFVAENI
jgi:hypothetical protein